MLHSLLLQEKVMDFSILSQAPFFKGYNPDEIAGILSGIRYRVKSFKAGSLIAQNGDNVNSLMIVVKGIVKGEMVDYAGRVIKIEDIPAPGALASAFIFGNKNRVPVNVIAVTDSELLIIEKPDLLKMLKTNDFVIINFLDMISNRSQFLSEKIKFLNFKTIKGKLAFYILQTAGKEKRFINLNMTQNDLAEFFGVARPSIARAIREMEDEGYIEAKGKTIEILNGVGLANLTVD
jgi:CRP-like cAMP-binding protein